MLAAPGSARTLGVPFRARIETVHVGPGARVRAGETIFSVAMPEVAAAAASYVSSGLRVGALQRRKAQLESLRGEGLARLQDLSEVEVKLAEAASDERIASATLSAAGLSTDQADGIAKAGGRVPLRSPIDGVVVALDTTAGESCEPSARLARIEAVGSGLLESRLPAALAEAGSFQFVPTSGPGRTAHLASRAPGLDPRDGTVLAWLKVEGPPLPAGLTGKLRARLGEGSLAVLVPSGALAWSDGHAVVMRRRGEQPEQLPVRVLSSTGADALVVGALQPGDEVAAEAQGVTGALQGAPEAIAKGEAVGAAGARP
jgi:multidrug efflux pump subunit AcrA (membrane-fusion protein)